MDSRVNSLHVVLKEYQILTEKRRTTFLNGVPSFVPVSSSTTEPSWASCKGKSDSRRLATVRPPPVQSGMPPTRIYLRVACCYFRRAAQPSWSYEDSRTRHSRTEQDTTSKCGQRCARQRAREAIHAQHSNVNSTRMRSEQDPDKYFYIMNSCRDRLNACDRPEGPTDRQYDDILLQASPPEYTAVRQAHLERGYFSLADIWRMMAANHADNLAVSRSNSFRTIAGRGATMQAIDPRLQ